MRPEQFALLPEPGRCSHRLRFARAIEQAQRALADTDGATEYVDLQLNRGDLESLLAAAVAHGPID